MVSKFWALIVGALLLLSTPAFAQEACQPVDQVLAAINQVAPVKAVVKLNAEQTAGVVAWYNAQPPVGEEKFNFALIIKHEDQQLGLVLGNDGLACEAVLVPAELLPSLLKAIAGTGA